ncbi:ParB/RepB/Spo0J family partition protein [Streptomyces sp. NPDC056987]|uniref:ParB/RepB/Spo0J family partition protein n=1 Tax=Streptomyces sp. NPDC056987 TaxID=3345988 RepID=UPI0036339167
MSKARQLGAGRFGGGVGSVSARRQAVAAATGVPTDGIAPPTELPPHHISLNPENPRSTLGDLTDLAGSLKTHGQKQAITVMNRDAYITANPEREADLEADTTYVVIDGSSRLAAAREAQLETVKILVSDDQGTTPEELLESALVANIHRQDLEEVDEARALQRLLTIHGSQTVLAKRLHRSQGWVSQRLALLNLTPELQARIGEEPIDLLRAVGNKPPARQEAALAELKTERARKETEKKERSRRSSARMSERPETGTSNGDYDVINEPREPAASTCPEEQSRSADQPAVPTPAIAEDEPPTPGSERATPPLPAQATTAEAAASADQQPKPFPYEDGTFAAQHLIRKMPPGELLKMLDMLIKHRDNQPVSAG